MKYLNIMILLAAALVSLLAFPQALFAQEVTTTEVVDVSDAEASDERAAEEGMSNTAAGVTGALLGGLGGTLGGGVMGAAYASGPRCTGGMCGLAVIPFGMLGGLLGLPIGALSGVLLNSNDTRPAGGLILGTSVGSIAGGIALSVTENIGIGTILMVAGMGAGGWIGYELADDDTVVSVSPTDGGASVSLSTTW